ncbi:MAG: hypothetical protein QOE01_1994 [Actinomycetota bacterium]|nr:hypothetical protein [Actinomycetota bacterium]
MAVVGEAARADELIDLYCARGADLCVADSGLPGDLLDAVRRVSAAGGKAVVLADHDDEHVMPCLVRAGARGYLSKSSSPDSLVRAFRAVMAGEVAIPRELVSRLLLDLQQVENRRSTDPELAHLTGRERQVLDLLRRGVATSDIAAELFVAPVTVRTHVSAIMRKLDLPDRAAVLVYARDAGLAAFSRREDEARDRVRAG